MPVTFTLRDEGTGDRRKVAAGAGLTVRQAVEAGGLIPDGTAFTIRDSLGLPVDDLPAADYADSLLTLGASKTARGGITIEEIASGFLALQLIGPFAQAFATKLGEQLGESAASAATRIRLRRRSGRAGTKQDELVISSPGDSVVIVVPTSLTDDARLALVDLDATDPQVQGKVLRWDAGAGSWHP